MMILLYVITTIQQSYILFPHPPLKNYPPLPNGNLPPHQLPAMTYQTAQHPKLLVNLYYQYKQGEHCPYLGTKSYDSLILVQHWPATLCQFSTLSHHFCNVTLIKSKFSSKFLLLSLRPANLKRRVRGYRMTQCCNLYAQEFKLVNHSQKTKNLSLDLLKHWPDLIHTKRLLLGLYSHEWIKYGTCIANTPYEYAKFALSLKKKVDLYGKLKKSGITKSSKHGYTKSQILDALKSVDTNVYPLLVCVKPNLSPFVKPVLFEVWNCFDRITLQPMNCTQQELVHTNECDDHDIVVLPNVDFLKEDAK
jgi:ribonuclease I